MPDAPQLINRDTTAPTPQDFSSLPPGGPQANHDFIPSSTLAYGIAIGSVVLATLLRFALIPMLGPSAAPYITYFPAIVLSAWVGGLQTGIVSLVLGALGVILFFIPPAYSLILSNPADLWSLFIFVLAGMGIASIGEAQRKARIRAEQSAHDAHSKEEILSTTMHSIGDAVIVTDLQGRITLMNAIAERLTGWTEEEAMGKPCDMVFRITNEATGEVVESPIEKVLKLGTAVGLANHTILTARDRTVYPIDDSGAPIKDRTGKLHGVVLVFRDVTERRQVEQELRESEARYRTMGDAVPDFIWSFRTDGTERYVNQRWMEYTGLSADESDAIPPDVMHHPEDYPKLEAIWKVAIAKKEPYEAEFRFRRHDGVYRWFMARAVPILDAEGNITQWIGTSTDIHERKVAEDALRASEERFRFALRNSDISVYMNDRDLCYTWVYSGRTNSERPQIYGKTDKDILEAEDAALLTEIKRRVLETGIEERHTVRATYKGQTSRYYDTLFAPLRDTSGNIIGVTGTVNDVTERKLAAEALERHQTEIEALNLQLRRSMRETHHRVKNNLQVIAALVSMQELQYTDHIPLTELQRLAQHIKALASIHDILTHQAQTDAELNVISVSAVMEKLIPMIQGLVGERKIIFDIQDILLPIRQSTTFTVLVNELVSNAVKHGAGAINVDFQVQGDVATLQVQDEGEGFPPDFNPVHSAHTGLDLVDSLAQMDMSGTVRYENRETGGARVVIQFPVSS